jgi:MFS family permease
MNMSKKQIVFLFICSLVPWTIGTGLLPILPIYALNLGANSAVAGFYVSFAFFSLTVGTIIAGWLSDKLQYRKLLIIIAGTIAVPTVFLMGRATNVLYLAMLNGISWFLYGMVIGINNIIVGLFAGEDERGKIFGIIGVSGALGGIIGGLSIGPMIDHWGYMKMFATLSVYSAILPISGLFLEDKVKKPLQSKDISTQINKPKFGKFFLYLLLAHTITIIDNGVFNIGRSFAMDNLQFTSSAITSTVVVGSVIMLPFPLLIGWLSDKIRRKLLMLLCYISYALSLLLLAFSKTLFHFWISAAFMQIGYVSTSVGAALVTDLVPKERLGVGLSLFQNTFWIGNVIGLAAAGYIIQNIGFINTFLIMITMPLIGIIFLMLIQDTKKVNK